MYCLFEPRVDRYVSTGPVGHFLVCRVKKKLVCQRVDSTDSSIIFACRVKRDGTTMFFERIAPKSNSFCRIICKYILSEVTLMGLVCNLNFDNCVADWKIELCRNMRLNMYQNSQNVTSQLFCSLWGFIYVSTIWYSSTERHSLGSDGMCTSWALWLAWTNP